MNKYLEGIKNSDKAVLDEIYKKDFPFLKKFVLNNNGDENDAKDVFQDALISVFRRLQKEDFEIRTTFGSYIFSVGKFIWFKKLKKKPNTSSIEDFQIGEESKIAEVSIEEQKHLLFEKIFKKLGEDCRKVLGFRFEKINFKKIAELMEYTSEEYARRKKYLCTKELVKRIKEDPDYLNFYN